MAILFAIAAVRRCRRSSWWRRPLPTNPYHRTYRWKDQVDFRYVFYLAVEVKLWRALTKPWRHPSCRWPVKCDQVPPTPGQKAEADAYVAELRAWSAANPNPRKAK